MPTFEVSDMTCGHCVSSITGAVAAVDPGAVVSADLATHRVSILRASAPDDDLSDAIKGAGYTPVAIDHPGSAQPELAPATRKGCCCG